LLLLLVVVDHYFIINCNLNVIYHTPDEAASRNSYNHVIM